MNDSRLVAFVSQREDALPIALTRIILGLTLFFHVGRFYTSGVARVALTNMSLGGFGSSHSWLEHVGGATEMNVMILGGVVIFSALLTALGLFTRVSVVTLWLSFRLMSSLNAEARGAYDSLMVDTLIVLCISGCGRALSLDQLIWKRSSEVSRWPRVLLVLQMALLYGGSAMMKVSSGWVPGGDASALWYILHQPMWVRWDPDLLPLWSYPITQVATTVTWFFELSGPLFFLSVILREAAAPASRFMARAKKILDTLRFREGFLILGLMMHIGIELFMEVGAFTPASLALYPCAFTPAEWHSFFTWVTLRLRRRPTAPGVSLL